ncbi:hypothetical protein EVJ58_g9752 [Rhodofomes roseus]|uniref:GH16 domain-containing protein n=1 Tax=Rhodofomes roseus TaxID=34475 RepID=A0A4Y9XT03_9APHY|nr:hypothetical protein EVJ58_g9752 [Rhodofomes roseus]
MHTLWTLTTVLPFVAAAAGRDALQSRASSGTYTLAKEYSGSSFFDGWDWYGAPDLLQNGDVNWVTEAQATAEQLAYVNAAGNAIIKVDNTTYVQANQKRDTVRITSQDDFPIGSVFVLDATHLPYGCSVWPSFWTTEAGVTWPSGGEIDIIETVNRMAANQYALHTGGADGCFGVNDTSVQTGTRTAPRRRRVITGVLSGDSAGEAFAAAGGGVYAAQFDPSGIFIWFWSRANIPSSVSSATNSIDTSDWGTPSAAFPSSSCDISEKFGPQSLVLDITLCGNWAGEPSVYNETCPTSGTLDANSCYQNSVVFNGTSDYTFAYFEIQYIKAFTSDGQFNVSVSASSSAAAATGTGGAPASQGAASSAVATRRAEVGVLVGAAFVLVGWTAV